MAAQLSPQAAGGKGSAFGALQVGFNAGAVDDSWEAHVQDFGERVFVWSGELLNRRELAYVLMARNPSLAQASDLELVHALVDFLGLEALQLVEGRFALLVFDKRQGKVVAARDALGLMPLMFFAVPGGVVFTTEAKAFRSGVLGPLVLKPLAAFDSSAELPDDFSMFENVRKVAPGGWVEFSVKGIQTGAGRYFRIHRPGSLTGSVEAVSARLKQLVEQSLDECTQGWGASGQLGVSLSGGLDSSLVASLAVRRQKGTRTFSVGTELANEFPEARVAARFAGSEHQEHEVRSATIIHGIVNAVFYNELFDSLSAEIASPLYLLYQSIEGRADVLLTGYGADLLFAGVCPPEIGPEQANAYLFGLVSRTLWTGEFSPFLASRFGLLVRNPYWNSRLMAFALSVPGRMKLQGQEVKKVLRDLSFREGWLPHEVAYRTKIGVHEGSGANAIFARYLGLSNVRDYRAKDRFVHAVFRELFIGRREVEELDLDRLRAEAC
ncbi:asparagine synthase-related protein [Hyalangium rubrum]|uniref:asparagine synthase (glutamine-hydrolyzing) n=1 Tax=Hyalangium rubrum TaxID=3103134 RepID=A0ABU5H4D0_9BACT|nr:asparagine synthase-related protein [Hyalangium sp. s54d21]MDY7228338.1 asparagine synthase-related protein [Hyalangium sp. s54d21]